MLLSSPGISVYSHAKQSRYSFSSVIISSRKAGSNLLLINVGRGLSPGPMSTSSKSSADVNPYPSLPSSKKSAANASESSLSAMSAANTGRWQEKLFGQPHG